MKTETPLDRLFSGSLQTWPLTIVRAMFGGAAIISLMGATERMPVAILAETS
jgi:hypothetical protein